MLSSLVSICPVDKNVLGYERVGYSCHGADRGVISGDDGDGRLHISCDDGYKRGDISLDDGRLGSNSKQTSHSYSRKYWINY